MSTSTSESDLAGVQPEVAEFMAQVRTHLLDLEPEELQDLTEGLGADLSDLVAERGRGALGDPADYARELRSAAGLEPVMRKKRVRRSPGLAVDQAFDSLREGWAHLVGAVPGKPMEFATAIRPVWWIVRAWTAVALLNLVVHQGDTSTLQVVPHLAGFGWLVLAVAVVGSVQIGRGRWWPGTLLTRTDAVRGWGRLLVLLLNLAALVAAPFMFDGATSHHYQATYDRGFDNGFTQAANEADPTASTDKAGIYADGKWVSNIYPYDAAGHPLVGVQLFNQIGKPINVVPQAEGTLGADGTCDPNVRVYYPWSNGASQLKNVYPLPSRLQQPSDPDPAAFTQPTRPAIGQFPFVSVPKVSLPGITPSAAGGKASYQPGPAPQVETDDVVC